MGIFSNIFKIFTEKDVPFDSTLNDRVDPPSEENTEYWVQLQRRNDDGTWENVENEKLGGVYRTIKYEKGFYTVSKPGVL